VELRRAPVEVRLLNGFDLVCSGRHVDLPLSARRLVAFLALQGRAVARVRVAGALWLDMTEERAHANLRSTLWRVNRHGHRLVDAVGSSLALTDGVAVDVRGVENRARHAIAGTDCETGQLIALASAGELLPDWYDDWVLLERERYRQFALHALEALATQFADAGRFGDAADAALAAVASEPLRESAHRLLIRVHIAEGNPTEALRGYRLYSKLLRDELGLEPSSSMRSLISELTQR
jgi:DNA-binding SARP family transcriptional activator